MNEPDHFERLGLQRRFSIDADAVESRYLARSREVHPDAHQFGSTSEQMASLEASAALNEAYRTLRDPFRRAEYLLALEGGPSASEMKEMPGPFLEQILEARMEIEMLKGEPADSPAVREQASSLAERERHLLAEVRGLFDDLGSSPAGGPLLREIRQRLNALKYVQGLQRDLHAD